MVDALRSHNPPKQARSQRTLERIVRTALEILNEEGPDAVTVQAVVARSGSSAGSFYARFAGKDELLAYLGERVGREATELLDDALASRDWSVLGLQEVVDGAVRLLEAAHRSRASYLSFMAKRTGSPADAYDAFHADVLGGVERVLLEHRAEIRHPDPALAVRLGLRAVLGILDATGGGEDRGGETPPGAVEEAVALLFAYLRLDRLGAPPSKQADFFFTWG
jgi:AcrR family transcriptional regulator